MTWVGWSSYKGVTQFPVIVPSPGLHRGKPLTDMLQGQTTHPYIHQILTVGQPLEHLVPRAGCQNCPRRQTHPTSCELNPLPPWRMLHPSPGSRAGRGGGSSSNPTLTTRETIGLSQRGTLHPACLCHPTLYYVPVEMR